MPPPDTPLPAPCPLPPEGTPTVSSPAGLRWLMWVRLWLWSLCAALLIMVALGGATRLTESGLSMVEWKPLTVLPPLTEPQWMADFEKYRLSPEYRHRTTGMTLQEYKGIFWLEYIHRLWGRAIGVLVLCPLLLLTLRRSLAPPLIQRMGVLFLLGGAQGGLGWLMVASGLVDRPDVSHYRLAAHFLMAVLVYGLLLHTALTLTHTTEGRVSLIPARRPHPAAVALTALTALTLTWGAFTAGLDAGLFYNTFPLMGDALLPPDLSAAALWPPGPVLTLLVSDPATVQFTHRALAILTVAALLTGWLLVWRRHRRASVRQAGLATAAAGLGQAGLGIVTLLQAVPVPLGVAHQSGGMLTVTLLIILLHCSGRPGQTPATQGEPS